jgi:hypothetical protein
VSEWPLRKQPSNGVCACVLHTRTSIATGPRNCIQSTHLALNVIGLSVLDGIDHVEHIDVTIRHAQCDIFLESAIDGFAERRIAHNHCPGQQHLSRPAALVHLAMLQDW